MVFNLITNDYDFSQQYLFDNEIGQLPFNKELIQQDECFLARPIANFLYTPLSLSSHLVVKLLMRQELEIKILAVFIATVLFFLTVPIALIGVAIQLIFDKSDSDYTINLSKKILSNRLCDSTPSKLKIMTWNMALGPNYMTASNGLRTSRERLNEGVQHICSQQADIVCLQEVFDKEIEQDLVKKLTKKGYDCVHSVMPSKLGLGSGLFVAIRRNHKYMMKIDHISAWVFQQAGGMDWFANKSLLGLKLRISWKGGEKPLYLFNTHLQSGAGSSCKKHRKAQISSIMEKVKQFISKEEIQPTTILCGDFNVDKWNANGEYQETIEQLQPLFHEVMTVLPFRGTCVSSKRSENDSSPLPLFDYIFRDESSSKHAESQIVAQEKVISDHLALTTAIHITHTLSLTSS